MNSLQKSEKRSGRSNYISLNMNNTHASSKSMSSRENQRLGPWLEAKINSGKFPGLFWINKEQRIFQIPWKHSGSEDWTEKDALIFKEWAIHKGRYREGVDKMDWPAWKTRLRCALNKQADITELKDQSCTEKSNPYRVYIFMDKKDSNASSPIQKQQISNDEKLPSNPAQLTMPPTNGCTLPTTIKADPEKICPKSDGTQGAEALDSLGSLANLSVNDLVPFDNSSSLTNISVDSNINSIETMDTGSTQGKDSQGNLGSLNAIPVSELVPMNSFSLTDISVDSNISISVELMDTGG